MAAAVQDCIFLLGDSLTQGGWEPYGFAQRLSYAYGRKLDVLNRGFGGYNTNWAIPVLEQCLAKVEQAPFSPKIRLMTIWFGANDACPLPSPQHVPLSKYKLNLAHIIDMIKSPQSPYYSPDTCLILITPPPVNEEQWAQDRIPPTPVDRFTEVTATYAEGVKEIGKEQGVPVVDIFTILWELVGKEQKELRKYLRDGLHLNETGYTVVFDELMKTISSAYPQLHPDKLQMTFAPWDTIDPSNFEAYLQKRSIDG